MNASVKFIRYPTNEGNTASPRIEEESLKSVFSKIVEESKSSERMNLVNSSSIESPKLVPFWHLPMETENVGGIVAFRIENLDGIWRRTTRDNTMVHTHDNIETISEKITYRKHIRDLEFETRELLERETSKKKFENIGTQLDKNQIDNNQMTGSTDSSKHIKTHEPKVHFDSREIGRA